MLDIPDYVYITDIHRRFYPNKINNNKSPQLNRQQKTMLLETCSPKSLYSTTTSMNSATSKLYNSKCSVSYTGGFYSGRDKNTGKSTFKLRNGKLPKIQKQVVNSSIISPMLDIRHIPYSKNKSNNTNKNRALIQTPNPHPIRQSKDSDKEIITDNAILNIRKIVSSKLQTIPPINDVYCHHKNQEHFIPVDSFLLGIHMNLKEGLYFSKIFNFLKKRFSLNRIVNLLVKSDSFDQYFENNIHVYIDIHGRNTFAYQLCDYNTVKIVFLLGDDMVKTIHYIHDYFKSYDKILLYTIDQYKSCDLSNSEFYQFVNNHYKWYQLIAIDDEPDIIIYIHRNDWCRNRQYIGHPTTDTLLYHMSNLILGDDEIHHSSYIRSVISSAILTDVYVKVLLPDSNRTDLYTRSRLKRSQSLECLISNLFIKWHDKPLVLPVYSKSIFDGKLCVWCSGVSDDLTVYVVMTSIHNIYVLFLTQLQPINSIKDKLDKSNGGNNDVLELDEGVLVNSGLFSSPITTPSIPLYSTTKYHLNKQFDYSALWDIDNNEIFGFAML